MKKAFVALIGLTCSAAAGCASGSRVTWQPLVDQPVEERPVVTPELPPRPAPTRAEQPQRVSTRWLGAEGASDYLLADLEDQLIGVWVDVPDVPIGRVPMALTLVVDTSGSMTGDKIRNARAAARALVHGLADGDIVAIETFSDRAAEVVPPTVLDAESREAVDAAVDTLSAQGGTNLHDALLLAERSARTTPATHPVRRIVLISDGVPTVGASSTDVLSAVAERTTHLGMQITAVGVGLDYDESMLDALAVQSSGRLYHLADAGDLPAILERETALLKQTMATNARLEVVPAPGVRVVGVEGARAEAGNDAVLVPLGTMFAAQRREVLLRVRLDGPAQERQPLASVRLHFVDPFDGSVSRVQEVVVRGQTTDDAELVATNVKARPRSIIAVQRAADMAEAAWRHVRTGDLVAAEEAMEIARIKLEEGATLATNATDRARLQRAAARVGKAKRRARGVSAAPRPAEASRAMALELNDVAMSARGF